MDSITLKKVLPFKLTYTSYCIGSGILVGVRLWVRSFPYLKQISNNKK